ncbi:hypothetical protein [Tabrizicola sp.]|uniref:hypothetical protein n=1 Tax=Tabrizicola sp. TaxID=2005166 RepID=UPI0035AEFD01
MDKAALFAMIMEEGAALRRHLATEAITSVLGLIEACERAIRVDRRLFFCGNGGSAATLCDDMPLVPSRITAQVREMHIALGHAVMELLEDRPGHA